MPAFELEGGHRTCLGEGGKGGSRQGQSGLEASLSVGPLTENKDGKD